MDGIAVDVQKVLAAEARRELIADLRRAAADPKELMARLTVLPPMEYDKVRRTFARLLGLRVETLDKEVLRARTIVRSNSEDVVGLLLADIRGIFDEAGATSLGFRMAQLPAAIAPTRGRSVSRSG